MFVEKVTGDWTRIMCSHCRMTFLSVHMTHKIISRQDVDRIMEKKKKKKKSIKIVGHELNLYKKKIPR